MILKSTSGVALATMISRLLGMLRDILFADYLGGGAIMSGWVIAFTIPNLFRRLLGEGALGTALIPILTSQLLEKDGKKVAAKNFILLVIVLGGLLSIISFFIGAISLAIAPFIETERVKLAMQILPILIPYSIFICLTGIATATLNVLKQFFLPVLSSLLLNISLIFSLYFIVPKLNGSLSILVSLSLAVLIAGFLQFIVMIVLLKKNDMLHLLPISQLKEMKNNKFLHDVWNLTLPGLIGASALQISLLVDRFLACYLGNHAVPALYYSDRIIFITIGIFALAMSTVTLPTMAEHASKNDNDQMVKTLFFGLRHMIFICAPAAFFTFFFREEIIRILFMRGSFGNTALNETSWALAFYALGIPFFATLKIIVSGFYSRKDMKTPVKIAIICISINIILNLILMWSLRQGGIALATVISSILNNTILLIILNKELKGINIKQMISPVTKTILTSTLAIIVALYAYKSVTISNKYFVITIVAIIFIITYFLLNLILNSKELKEWMRIFKK